jgi:hypothetical protein
VPDTAAGQDRPGEQGRTPDGPAVIELHQPRRPAAVALVPARNGLPEPKRYVYRGTGHDQLDGDDQ